MTLQRGDVITTRFPHAGDNRGKKRPAVIVQADSFNSNRKHFIVAEITGNLAAGSDPASFTIDIATPEGAAIGLDRDSVVCCLFLATIGEGGITKVLGKLSASMLGQLDGCLKVAMQIP